MEMERNANVMNFLNPIIKKKQKGIEKVDISNRKFRTLQVDLLDESRIARLPPLTTKNIQSNSLGESLSVDNHHNFQANMYSITPPEIDSRVHSGRADGEGKGNRSPIISDNEQENMHGGEGKKKKKFCAQRFLYIFTVLYIYIYIYIYTL